MCGGVGPVAAVAGREVREEQRCGSFQRSPRSFPEEENREKSVKTEEATCTDLRAFEGCFAVILKRIVSTFGGKTKIIHRSFI